MTDKNLILLLAVYVPVATAAAFGIIAAMFYWLSTGQFGLVHATAAVMSVAALALWRHEERAHTRRITESVAR